MSDFPPLPCYLTLEEAAQVLTDRTGKQWTQRQILGCAERHEITVYARIDHSVKFVRVHSIEGRTNEICAEKGSLPRLDTEAIRALLLAGEAYSKGWEELAPVDFFGEPVEAWQKVFELAPGEDAPVVRLDVCRVNAAGVLQVVDTYTKTTKTQLEPASEPDVSKGTPKKLSDSQEEKIIKLYNGSYGQSVNSLAKQFAVSRPTINKVLKRKEIKK